MNRPHLVALCVVFAGCATTSTTPFYPLDELRALDAAENRAELLAHAIEVAPSKREDAWRGLVERAAIATLDEVEVKNVASAEQGLALTEQLAAKFVFLKRSPAWLAKRANVAIAAFPWVQENARSQDWTRRVLEFARGDTTTPHVAQRLAEEVIMKRLIASTALPFYELALEREGVEACKAASLPKVVLETIDYGDAAKNVIMKCWPQLEAPLLEGLKKAETRTLKLKFCAAMAAHTSVKDACTFDN